MCYCQLLLLCLLVFVLCIEVVLCWCTDIYNCHVFLLDRSLDHYIVSFLISCNLLYFKVYFVWYEDCYSSFLLLPICMEYIFPSSHFNAIEKPKMNPRQSAVIKSGKQQLKWWNIHIYLYSNKESQNSPAKIKYSRLTWQTKEIKNYIYQLRTKLTKAQTRKQN